MNTDPQLSSQQGDNTPKPDGTSAAATSPIQVWFVSYQPLLYWFFPPQKPNPVTWFPRPHPVSSKLTLFADDMTLPHDFFTGRLHCVAVGHHCHRYEGGWQPPWTQLWQMLLYVKRSHSIPPPTLYTDTNTALMQVDSVKYLGIQLTSDLAILIISHHQHLL